MSRYRKYTDNYLAILAGLGLNQEVGIDTRATSKAKYTKDVLKDKYRATVVELRDPEQYNAETAREQIYSPANFEQYPRYGQGEYDAAFSYWITNLNPDLVKIYNESSDPNLKAYFAVPYIDDNGIPCALSVTRFGHGSTAQFFITLVRNTHEPYEEREVAFIAHNDIMKTSCSLFTQEGTITEENFVQLKARIRHRNVDNRDILIPQIPRLIKIVNKINVGLAQEIQSKYTQDFVDFFKQERYEQLLLKVIADAKAHCRTQPKAITELQDLYLEFLIIQLHADRDDSRESFLTGGISETESAALLARFKKVAPQAHNTADFAEKINQFYRNIHYSMLITKLKHAIHDSESKLVRDNAKSELQWIRSLSDNFLNLKSSKQKTAIAFVTQLISFTQTPNDEGYRALKKLYPKVRLEPAKLENVKSNLEIIRFNQQITALKRNLKTCPHPYVRRELAKNVEFVKKILPSFQDSSIDQQISINQFLEKLNELTTENSEFNLRTLEEHYTQLSLLIIPREKRAQLLLPTNIACMQHEIEKNNYLFDTQGRILVSTLDSTQNNQPTAQFYRISVDNLFPYNIYAGQQDNSSVIIASRNNGGSITERDWSTGAGCESAYLAFDPNDPTLVYGGCYQGYIEVLNKKTNETKDIQAYPTLNLAIQPKDMKYRFNWNAPIVVSPHDSKTIYHAGNVLLRTTNGGMSWDAISPDLTRNEKSKQGPGGIPFTNEGAGGENYNTIYYVAESAIEKGV
ncbi:MAG: hypothetical protein EBY22_06605, partial [Gammaproteobacteria bacterium]|nr:hypothetical protein [Gammaproteobacteria bacterium]